MSEPINLDDLASIEELEERIAPDDQSSAGFLD